MEDRTLGRCLTEYAGGGYYPYHMPGHKRRGAQGGSFSEALAASMRYDITEIDGFDNLHKPEGILLEAQKRAAALYGADDCFYSVNGSTAGILTAVSAAVPEGGKLIMARNCHKAVYHSVYLRHLEPVYLYPGTVGDTELAAPVTAAQVEEALEQNPDAKAVLIVSPTYDGVAADVAGIAKAVHRRGVPLIVDAAHGAHFGLHPGFPESPVRLGADLTVVSLHKTMPCPTQTALLLCSGSRVAKERLRLFEGIYQTSSPSYLLMAAMDECVSAVRRTGAALWDAFFRERAAFLEQCSGLSGLRILTDGTFELGKTGEQLKFLMDPGKILIETSKTCLTGKQFYDILLEQYHLQMEMAAGNYVTAIMTCCDSKEGWQRLAEALVSIDRSVAGSVPGHESRLREYPFLEKAVSLTEALDAPKEKASLEEAEGKISGGFVNLYPPGIPVVVPGERISCEAARLIMRYRQQNLPLQGAEEGAITILK